MQNMLPKALNKAKIFFAFHFQKSNFAFLACVPRYLVGRERMFLLGPIQYKAEYNVRNTKQNFMQNLTYSYLLQLCTRVDIYNKELNLNIWRSKLSDKLKVAWNLSFWEGYCLWIRRCEVNIAKGTTDPRHGVFELYWLI